MVNSWSVPVATGANPSFIPERYTPNALARFHHLDTLATSSLSRNPCINLPCRFLCLRPLQHDAVHNSIGPAFPFLSFD